MILINDAANTLNGDLHSVPTVHLPNTNLAAIADVRRRRQEPPATI